jgi:hypothetical protein
MRGCAVHFTPPGGSEKKNLAITSDESDSSCKDEKHSARRCRPAATPGKPSYKFTNPERVVSIPQIPLVTFDLPV